MGDDRGHKARVRSQSISGASDLRRDIVKPSPPRKFGLLDAMILVFGLALGSGCTRIFLEFDSYLHVHPDASFSDVLEERFARAECYLNLLILWLASLSAATLAIRLRRPRPSLRRLARQPGLVACAAAIAVGTLLGVFEATAYSIEGFLGLANLYENLISIFRYNGISVCIGWLVLAVCGAWRPERSWIDRLGRGLGVLWIATSLTVEFAQTWRHVHYLRNVPFYAATPPAGAEAPTPGAGAPLPSGAEEALPPEEPSEPQSSTPEPRSSPGHPQTSAILDRAIDDGPTNYLVAALRAGMSSSTLRVGDMDGRDRAGWRDKSLASGRGASEEAFPRRAWERG
jgi:hypothetical protein